MDSKHLLVPIKVQALVIDDIVIKKSGVIEFEPGRFAANDGRWSPQLYDYQPLATSLSTPGPKPFYGAGRTFQGHAAEQLVFDKSSSALAQDKDRGVYLHWVLPAGLRHAYTPGLLDFPALPDHWLIVRFSRRGTTSKTKAWFVDGGAIVGDGGPAANLLFPGNEKHVARRVGKVIPFEEFASANSSGERTTITALGNDFTGSPTFTAFIAENRNIFSWHDKLEDLREPNRDGKIPEGTTLTYALLGWYRDPKNEPLASPAVQLSEKRDKHKKLLGWLIDPPGWFIETSSTTPPDLLKRRSVFHGIVAHINYWSAATYKGEILGYPGAPAVSGTLRKPPPPFKVGVGNNAEDALVSLVSSEYSDEHKETSLAKEQPNLWKALEAVIYRQPETLIRSWNVATRDITVHQNSFATREAGKLWYLRPKSDKEGAFSPDPQKTAAETATRPTAEQLVKLNELNQTQSEADAVSRELGALQQELYARWWKVCARSRTMRPDVTDEEKDCREVAKRVAPLRTKRDLLLTRARTLQDELENKLPKDKLELKYDAAPRFWMPADPVIVLKNAGLPAKHQFPNELPCRLPEEIVTAAEVVVNKETKQFDAPVGVSEIAAAAQQHLPACPDIINALLNEASLVEQAIQDLAVRSLPAEKLFPDSDAWQRWTERLVDDVTWNGDPDSFPSDQIKFDKANNFQVRADRLVDLWVKQPWSPLFIDWQITWFPTALTSTTEQPFGPVWNFRDADFVPSDIWAMPGKQLTIRGRSLLAPIDERIFQEPIETLRALIAGKNDSAFTPAVKELMTRYEIVWDNKLKELADAGLMGQALSGFHQALLRRDVTLPRITPDPTRPWIHPSVNLKTLEAEVSALLDAPGQEGLTAERLAPPAPKPTTTQTTTPPFSILRAGALRIDELWLVDDFGQSADLLGLTTTRSKTNGQAFHPRMRWHNDRSVFAMPPRVLQPVRLNFRFTSSTDDAVSALSPICGWIFYNPLDQALVLCDRNGQLAGHLAIVKDQRGTRVDLKAENISNQHLKDFAESLVETTPIATPKLVELLQLIDNALERIRPAAGRRDLVLVGRPLALVNATLGLELFGKAWNDPNNDYAAREGTGDATLDALRVRVNLGDAHSIEDGLVGFFKGKNFSRFITTQTTEQTSSTYVVNQKNDPARAAFSAPEQITLLLDPWGSVQAACGIVPAKMISLTHAELDKVVAQMEVSFRVGPVLVQTGKLTLPAPAVDKGAWNFSGPLTEEKTTSVVPLDPRYFSDQPVVVTEGRLLLLNEE